MSRVAAERPGRHWPALPTHKDLSVRGKPWARKECRDSEEIELWRRDRAIRHARRPFPNRLFSVVGEYRQERAADFRPANRIHVSGMRERRTFFSSQER